jgi:hypothetical protein
MKPCLTRNRPQTDHGPMNTPAPGGISIAAWQVDTARRVRRSRPGGKYSAQNLPRWQGSPYRPGIPFPPLCPWSTTRRRRMIVITDRIAAGQSGPGARRQS